MSNRLILRVLRVVLVMLIILSLGVRAVSARTLTQGRVKELSGIASQGRSALEIGRGIAHQALDRLPAGRVDPSLVRHQAAAIDAVRIPNLKDAPFEEVVKAVAQGERVSMPHLVSRADKPAHAQVHGKLKPAIKQLVARYGMRVPDHHEKQLARLSRIAPGLASALGGAISAYLTLKQAADAGSRHDLFDSRWTTDQQGDLLSGMDEAARPALTGLLLARRSLLLAVEELAAAERLPPHVEFKPIVVAPVLALDVDGSDWKYKKNVALTIDVGGNDWYRNNAGGSSVLVEKCESVENRRPGVGALIDLEGNDTYGDLADPGECGTNGGGFFGVGFLVDIAGDDSYAAAGTSTNGGGTGGLGFLVDAAGDDRYGAKSLGTNGGSNGGAGFLFDAAGDDIYSGEAFGTNGGGYGGSGLLVDTAGNDEYLSLGYGANGGGYVGSGHLLDLRGNDSYTSAYFGVNGGADVGTGLLLDASGRDFYFAGKFGTNGGAWAAGLGLLLDLKGADSYEATDLATNGGGGFNGSGILIDAAGDDRYKAGSFGTNGGAALGSTGQLIDVAGNDRYVAARDGANGGGATGWGCLVDLDGRDSYQDRDGGTGRDKTVVPKGSAGAQIDA